MKKNREEPDRSVAFPNRTHVLSAQAVASLLTARAGRKTVKAKRDRVPLRGQYESRAH
jgi:hypothetical protein